MNVAPRDFSEGEKRRNTRTEYTLKKYGRAERSLAWVRGYVVQQEYKGGASRWPPHQTRELNMGPMHYTGSELGSVFFCATRLSNETDSHGLKQPCLKTEIGKQGLHLLHLRL